MQQAFWLLLAGWVACERADTPPRPAPPAVTPSGPSVARLSHGEWENAVQDALGLAAPTGLGAHFLVDAQTEGFDNEAQHLRVDPVLWAQYLAAATAVADLVVQDPALLERVTGGDPPEQWIPRFGERVHRHPLGRDDVDLYLRAYAEGELLAPGGSEEGVRQVLSLMFQSPWFVYRLERTGVGGSPLGELDGWDSASRLSFALWNTAPDDALLAAARAGDRFDGATLAFQAERLLAAPRARETVVDLHRQLLLTDAYSNISPHPSLFAGFDEVTVDAMRTEVDRFVENVVFSEGSLRDLLLESRRTFVNADLAAIYGVSGVPRDAWAQPVDLDPATRGGVTTLAGFLALTSTAVSDHPIVRGVAVHHAWTCVSLPAPPPGATPVPPPTGAMTTRERIEAHTGDGTCGEVCHSTLINPIGYAYGHYGGVGEWRETEVGLPIDASAAYSFSTGRRSFDGALELLAILLEQPDVHECYVSHLFAYVYGRQPSAADEALVKALAARSLKEDRPIRALLADLVTDPGFLDR